MAEIEHTVPFTENDVYVIVTPDGEEVHITRVLALAVQYALLSGGDVTQVGERWELLTWLDEHAVTPFIERHKVADVRQV